MLKDKIMEEIKKTLKELAESQKRTDREIANLTESQKKTDREIEKVNKMVGNLTDGWGKFVESIVVPSIPIIFKGLGIDIFSLSSRIKRYKNGKELEIDILCLGKDKAGKDIAIITEVKSDVSSKDINSFLKDIEDFRYFFDEYKDKDKIGVIAGMRLGKGVQRYAERCGLYVLGPSGEMMQLLTKPDFKPKIWQ